MEYCANMVTMPDSPRDDLSAISPYRLAGPHLCEIRDGQVKYTQEGLRLYTALFRRHGKPLPLPGDEASYRTAMWDIVDTVAAELVAETAAALPDMAKGEAAVARAWLEGDHFGILAAAAEVEQARIQQESLCTRGANVVGLSLARLCRRVPLVARIVPFS